MVKLFTLSTIQVIVFCLAAAQYREQSNCTTPDNLPGFCIGISKCPLLRHLLHIHPSPKEVIDYLGKSQCDLNIGEIRVCCVIQRTSQNEDTEINPPYDLTQYSFLPTDCGEQLTDRILLEGVTLLDEFPWLTLLEYDAPTGKHLHCGGFLISRRYVVTAARCIKEDPLSVRLGEYDISSDRDCMWDKGNEFCTDEPVTIKVEEKIVHEKYRPKGKTIKDKAYDIALLRLEHDITFTIYIKPICLPSTADFVQKLFVAGWGMTENGTFSNVKLKVDLLPPVYNQQCQASYGEKLGYGQMCAGGHSCRGDSGGPLMFLNRDRNGIVRWTVAGIISFGQSSCGVPERPGVYIRMIDFVPWILSKMKL